MKIFVITLVLILTISFGSNAENLLPSAKQHSERKHGHIWHSKGDRHHKGVRFFHRHHNHEKNHTRSDAHSYQGRGRQEGKGSKDNK